MKRFLLFLPIATMCFGAQAQTVVYGPPSLGQPYFLAYLSSNQTVTTAVSTKIQFNTVVYDSSNRFDGVTNFRFTPLVSGKYMVTLNVSVTFSGSGSVGQNVSIFKNGAVIANSTYTTANTNAYSQTMPVTNLITMNGSTDFLEGFVTLNGITTTNVIGSQSGTYFQAVYVGP